MARWTIKNVRFAGVAACVPNEVVKTSDFPFFTEEEAVVFDNTVGIRERHLGPESLCASDICQAAAEKLLAQLGWDKESVDMLIFESVTPDYKTPPTSCILQHRIGLPDTCFCLDIPMGCCGCMYAINVAGNMLSSGNIHRAILLVGDTAARMGSNNDKSRLPLFGDAGCAMALEYDPTAEDIVIDFHTLGSGHEALMTPHGGFRHPITAESFIPEDFGNGIIRAPKDTLIKGMDVFSFAISLPPRSVDGFLNEYEIDREQDIDHFLIHQANKMIVDRVVKKLKLPVNKVPYNLEEFGNTGGCSIPLLMVTRIADDLRTKQQNLICSSFGLGLTWGTMWLKTDKVEVCDLITI